MYPSPPPWEEEEGERAVQDAISSWRKTTRLCLIYLARGAPAAGAAIAWWLMIRH